LESGGFADPLGIACCDGKPVNPAGPIPERPAHQMPLQTKLSVACGTAAPA
jgi:hypothetical protein